VVGSLRFLELRKFSRQLEHLSVCLHESVLLEVDTLLDEDSGHGHQVLV
jgi:hypothetical protein